MNLDDVIKLARRLWPADFDSALVVYFRRTGYTCTVSAGQTHHAPGDSVSGACTAMVHRLREIEASRGRPS